MIRAQRARNFAGNVGSRGRRPGRLSRPWLGSPPSAPKSCLFPPPRSPPYELLSRRGAGPQPEERWGRGWGWPRSRAFEKSAELWKSGASPDRRLLAAPPAFARCWACVGESSLARVSPTSFPSARDSAGSPAGRRGEGG